MTPALLAATPAALPAANLDASLPSSGYLREAQLIPAIIPFSSATLWRKVKAGHFPKPVKLSTRITAWRVEDVRAWMQARNAA
jgi:predicted DNA-binding transcriptional regulator AlpA